MSEEKIVGILQKVRTPCIRCNSEVVGFMIPDGRFICPNCDPPAVFERWKREWEPHKQAILSDRREKKEAELAAKREEMKESLKAQERQEEIKKAEIAARRNAERREETARVNARIAEEKAKEAEIRKVELQRPVTGAELNIVLKKYDYELRELKETVWLLRLIVIIIPMALFCAGLVINMLVRLLSN